MKNIIHLMHKEFIQTLRDKRMIAIIAILPFVQLIILGYAANIDIKNISLVVCDNDRTQNSYDLISAFINSGYFTLIKNVDSPKLIDEEINKGNASVGLIIQNDFTRNILSNNQATIQIIADGSDANSANYGLGYAKQIVNLYSNSLFQKKTMKSGINVKFAKINPIPRVWFNPELKSSNYMIPGILALILMITTMGLASLGIVREKEIGTLEQLIVTPIKRFELIIGKLIPFIIFGFIQIIIVITIARLWFEVPLRGNLFTLFFLSGLYILTTLGLGLLVSSFSKTQQQAMLTSIFFIILPFMYLSGFAFPIDNMPKFIQYTTYLIPLKYYLIIVRSIFLKGNTLFQLWKEALFLLIFGITILLISIKTFNKRLD
ncbi:MAG TPA: ABC transporter permease [Bacteroidota bacterium]|jgi:ABC-2 type transport system permease protein|nr:ABC transporter permease [Bacteroidota bacterium]